MPVARLPLNARAEAWLQYLDQLSVADAGRLCADCLSGRCSAENIFISAYPGRLDHGASEQSVAPHAHRLDERNGSDAAAGRAVPARPLARALRRRRPDHRNRPLHVRSRRHRRPPPHGVVRAEEGHGALSADRRQQHAVDHHAGRPDVPDEAVHLRGHVQQGPGTPGPRQGWRQCDAESARRERSSRIRATKYPDGRK